METDYTVKDSGQRIDYPSGMRRDVNDGKTNFSLLRDGPMHTRWAEHLTKGAVKYGKRNWQLANSVEEADRFMESAARHFEAWFAGETDEDHAAAVFFNINAAEYVIAKINEERQELSDLKAVIEEAMIDAERNLAEAWGAGGLHVDAYGIGSRGENALLPEPGIVLSKDFQ